MSINISIKEQIENELSALVGERIRRFIRAALMVGIDFGEDIVEIYCLQSKKSEYV